MKPPRPPRLAVMACALLVCVHARADRIELVTGGGADTLPAAARAGRLREPFGCGFDSMGNLWIVEMESGNRLLKVDPSGTLHHVAGGGPNGFSGDGGAALHARFSGPHNLAVLPNGDVLVGDTWNGRIRRLDARTGDIRSEPGFEVPLENGRKAGPYCITLDPDGRRLWIADLRQVWSLDLVTHERRLFAGNGTKGVPRDGAIAAEAPLVDPRAVAADGVGNVYVLERTGNALRAVDREGRIRTVVNASGTKGATGDGGPALKATLNGPKHLCIDKDGSVLIADAENNLIRRYIPGDELLVRVAGTGIKGSRGVGGAPKECELARPHGVTVHPKTGELYITDSYNHRVLKIVRE